MRTGTVVHGLSSGIKKGPPIVFMKRSIFLLVLLAFLVPFVSILVLSINTMHQLDELHGALDRIVNTYNQRTEMASRAQQAAFQRTENLYRMVMMDDAFDRDEAFMAFNRSGYDVGLWRTRLRDSGLDTESYRLYLQQSEVVQDIVDAQDRAVDLLAEDQVDKARRLLIVELLPMQRRFDALMQALRDRQQDAANEAVLDAESNYYTGVTLSRALAGGCIILGVIAGLVMYYKLRHQSRNIKEALDQLQASQAHWQGRAMRDALTSLANRVGFIEQFEQVLEQDSGSCALVYLDLNGFKQVNDTLGHHAGDLLLKSVAGRLKGAIRSNDLAARLGGDEFAILLRSVRDKEQGRQIAETLATSLSAPYEVDGQIVHVSASIGLSHYPEDARDSSTLLRLADERMYEVKRGDAEEREKNPSLF